MPHPWPLSTPLCTLQSKIGKIQYADNKNDVRFQQFVLELDYPEWTPEQVYELITQNGTATRPEDYVVGVG